MWSRIRGSLNLPESGPTGITWNQVNQLRATATSIRTSGERFGRLLASEQRTGLPQSLTAREISSAPWSRPVEERQTIHRYQLNFQMTMEDSEGNQETDWFTTYVRGPIPSTAGEIQALVEGDADLMAGGYGKSLVGVGDVQVIQI